MKLHNESKSKRYYDYGAHFPYIELYTRLVNLQKTLQYDNSTNEIKAKVTADALNPQVKLAGSDYNKFKAMENQFNQTIQKLLPLKPKGDNFVKLILNKKQTNYLFSVKPNDNSIGSNNILRRAPSQSKRQIISLRKREESSIDKDVFNKSIHNPSKKASNQSFLYFSERELFLPKLKLMHNKSNKDQISLSKVSRGQKNSHSFNSNSLNQDNKEKPINIVNSNFLNKSYSRCIQLNKNYNIIS